MLGPNEFLSFKDKIDESLLEKVNGKKQTHTKKLDGLIQKCKPKNITCEHNFFPKVLNETNVQFSDSEISD